MRDDIISDIDRESFRENLNEYTRMAFRQIPRMGKPRILDIGCGSGVPMLELARLSQGQIIAVDIDQSLLGRLAKKLKRHGLEDRVELRRASLLDMDFGDERFDIVWAEGSVFVVGFAKALQEWRRLIWPHGYLVIHDELGDFARKLEAISLGGYRLIDDFILTPEVWWAKYYCPLSVRLSCLLKKYDDDEEALGILNGVKEEVDRFKEGSASSGSIFFVMQKTN
jgi:ubiquinone/menaquinone biosynthesis C-methylase UbiE